MHDQRRILRCLYVFLFLFCGFVADLSAVQAAIFSNLDTREHKLIITEKGVRKDVSLPANGRVEACLKGCFVIFPSGEILPLRGSEDIAVEEKSYQLINQ